jgi:hypothetical protein
MPRSRRGRAANIFRKRERGWLHIVYTRVFHKANQAMNYNMLPGNSWFLNRILPCVDPSYNIRVDVPFQQNEKRESDRVSRRLLPLFDQSMETVKRALGFLLT